MNTAATVPRRKRSWGLTLLLLAAALLHAASWAGFGLGAFVLWNSIHAFYFQQSYAAGWLPLAMAGLLAAAGLCLILKRARWAAFPAFVAMILSFVMLPRLGLVAPPNAFIHPMQSVPWAALALGWAGCIWLFASLRRAARP